MGGVAVNDPRWHIVWIDKEADGWAVRCLPHGFIAHREKHFDAFLCAYEHDFEITRTLKQSAFQ